MAEKKIKKEKIDNVGIHSFSKKADIFFSTISGLIALSCICLLYTSPSPRDRQKSRMPSSA